MLVRVLLEIVARELAVVVWQLVRAVVRDLLLVREALDRLVVCS